MEAEAFRGISVCYRTDCQQRWWVMWLGAGPVETQLVPVFGEELARVNMATWKLPEHLDVGMYWQISISKRQYEEHGAGGSHRILSMLVALFRTRSSIDRRNN
jgi:hypothetical protein